MKLEKTSEVINTLGMGMHPSRDVIIACSVERSECERKATMFEMLEYALTRGLEVRHNGEIYVVYLNPRMCGVRLIEWYTRETGLEWELD